MSPLISTGEPAYVYFFSFICAVLEDLHVRMQGRGLGYVCSALW